MLIFVVCSHFIGEVLIVRHLNFWGIVWCQHLFQVILHDCTTFQLASDFQFQDFQCPISNVQFEFFEAWQVPWKPEHLLSLPFLSLLFYQHSPSMPHSFQPWNIPCPVDGCNLFFTNHSGLRNHTRVHCSHLHPHLQNLPPLLDPPSPQQNYEPPSLGSTPPIQLPSPHVQSLLGEKIHIHLLINGMKLIITFGDFKSLTNTMTTRSPMWFSRTFSTRWFSSPPHGTIQSLMTGSHTIVSHILSLLIFFIAVTKCLPHVYQILCKYGLQHFMVMILLLPTQMTCMRLLTQPHLVMYHGSHFQSHIEVS